MISSFKKEIHSLIGETYSWPKLLAWILPDDGSCWQEIHACFALAGDPGFCFWRQPEGSQFFAGSCSSSLSLLSSNHLFSALFTSITSSSPSSSISIFQCPPTIYGLSSAVFSAIIPLNMSGFFPYRSCHKYQVWCSAHLYSGNFNAYSTADTPQKCDDAKTKRRGQKRKSWYKNGWTGKRDRNIPVLWAPYNPNSPYVLPSPKIQ